MNIFYLDDDPQLAAQYQNDKHCVKMVTETAQLLCSALRHRNFNEDWMYKMAHKHHPCTLWAINWNNFNWLVEHGIQQAKEYTYRYGKIHKSESIIRNCKKILLSSHYLWSKHEKPPLAMPEKYHDNDPVKAYRNYYIGDKQYYTVKNKKTGEEKKIRFIWNKNRTAPSWWKRQEVI